MVSDVCVSPFLFFFCSRLILSLFYSITGHAEQTTSFLLFFIVAGWCRQLARSKRDGIVDIQIKRDPNNSIGGGSNTQKYTPSSIIIPQKKKKKKKWPQTARTKNNTNTHEGSRRNRKRRPIWFTSLFFCCRSFIFHVPWKYRFVVVIYNNSIWLRLLNKQNALKHLWKYTRGPARNPFSGRTNMNGVKAKQIWKTVYDVGWEIWRGNRLRINFIFECNRSYACVDSSQIS